MNRENRLLFDGRHYAVVGATGALGQSICRALVCHGAHVTAMSRNVNHLEQLQSNLGPISIRSLDVTDPQACLLLGQEIEMLDGVVYTVGDCPPGGFDDAIRLPLSTFEANERLYGEWKIQVAGLQQVIATLLPKIQDGGQIVVMNSDINRIPAFIHPASMHDGHYASAKMAQEQMVKRMRQNDPIVKRKKISLPMLFPMAVDTPFHMDSDNKPPATVSTEQVADAVIRAIQRNESRDYRILPPVYQLIWGAIKKRSSSRS